MIRGVAACAAWIALAAAPARAHYLWIEPGGDGHSLYFGEYDEKLHESSPGRLDEMPAPRAWTLRDGKRVAVDARRGASGFAIAVPRGAAVLAEETGYSVRDWTANGIGVAKPMFYARHAADPGAVEASLALDVVPQGSFEKLAVVFDRQPLAKTKLTLFAPNGWSREHHTAADGSVAVRLPWPGMYVAEVIHLERVAGDFQGKAYQLRRHRATLSFEKR